MMSNPTDATRKLRYALEGKVATMDDHLTILDRGVVYVAGNRIAAVRPFGEVPPPDFEDVPLLRTGGTIYPGLIELHNHLSYDILPLWAVPERFDNRGQWRSDPEKRKLVTAPMQVLGRTPRYVPAIARYVEAKCLLAGVTTSQGLALYGVGIQPYYRGVVRNVEDTDDDELPEARTKISDVEAGDGARFLERLQSSSCLLLHLSEGADAGSRRHFEALRLDDGTWAITPALAGIHCVPLTRDDFQIMADHGAAMIWSPLSNLLLYGETADIAAARGSGVLMGLGSDWSPTGSKNLLCELKVAQLMNESWGGVLEKHELVSMVTRDAARILKWEGAVGSLEAGKRADLIVVTGRQGDPYGRLLAARESSLGLVVIDGVPRCGQPRLMEPLGGGGEMVGVGGAERLLNLTAVAEGVSGIDPLVRDLTLTDARDLLQDGLARLPELARALEEGTTATALLARMAQGRRFATPGQALDMLAGLGFAPMARAQVLDADRPIAFLVLEQDELPGESLRPHLRHAATGERTGFPLDAEMEWLRAAGVPYSQLLADVQIELDAWAVAGDDGFFARLALQLNLPDGVKTGLPLSYGVDTSS